MPELSSLSETTLTRRLKKFNTAASHFIGTHDFMAFRAEGSNVKTTVRTILRAEVNVIPPSVTVPCPLLCFEITGDGFLYNMVRIMAGTLIEVYKGKILPSDIPFIIESKDRTRAGMTAPPDGLYLHEVFYPN
jgi:tRNA pseudouridine38-40 synthase